MTKNIIYLLFTFSVFTQCFGGYLDITDLTKLTTTDTFASGALCASFSKDGRFLATGGIAPTKNLKISSFDGTILNTISQALRPGDIYTVDWSHDGRYLAIGTSNVADAFRVYEFDGTSLTSKDNKATTNTAYSVKWHPSGTHIALAEQNVKVYSFNGSTLTQIFSDPYATEARSVDWSPDGRYLAAGGDSGGTTDLRIYSFDGTTVTNILSIDFGSAAYSVAWNPDGKYLAVGGNNSPKYLTIYSFDGSSLIEVQSADPGGTPLFLNWNTDGKYIATYRQNGIGLSKLSIYSFTPFEATILNEVCDYPIGGNAGAFDWDISGKYLGIGNQSFINEPVTILLVNKYQFLKTINTIPEIIYFQNPLYINTETLLSGALKLLGGINVLENTRANLDLLYPIHKGADLNGTGQIRLFNDLHLANNFTFTQGGDISGQGYSIFLDGDLIINDNVDLKFTSSTIIDGQGHNLILGHRAQLLVDSTSTLTLKNLTLKNQLNTIAQPAVKCIDWYGKLALDNVVFALNDDFSFYNGQLFIHNDFIFTGTSQFLYQAVQPCYITPHATMYFDQKTSFKYYPSSSDKTLIQMQDDSSNIYFNGSSLKSTFTGLQLTTGNVVFDNKVTISTASILDIKALGSIDSKIFDSVDAVAWSPNGQYLTVGGFNTSDDIIIYSFDGSALTEITSQNFGTGLVICLSWSPNNKYLAAGGNNASDDVIIYSFDESALTEITTLGFGTSVYSVEWSPNGQYLAVAGIRSTYNFGVYSFDGSNLALIDSKYLNPGALVASWSPDGKHIIAAGSNSPNDIIIYSFDGSTLTQLDTIDYGTQVSSASWSPDAKYIAIAGVGAGATAARIYYFNGSTLSLVTSLDLYKADLRWSPDGQYILAGLDDSSSDNIRIYRFNGSELELTAVHTFGDDVMACNWDPSGKFIAIGGNNNPDDLIVYQTILGPSSQIQAPSNSISFQDLTHNLLPDANVKITNGGKAILNGPMSIINGGISGGFIFNSSNGFNLNNDVYFDSTTYFTKGGTINANGYAIYLDNDLNVPDYSTLMFPQDTIIDAQGHSIILGNRSQLLVDSNATLTIKNGIFKNTLNTIAQPPIKCSNWNAKLALDNVELELNDDFNFYNGQLFIHNDVLFSGTSQFIYQGVRPSHITSHSTLYFNKGTSFKYNPATSQQNLINLTDDTSNIYFDGCTLKSTFTGLQLTTGNVYFDNKVSITTAAALKLKTANNVGQTSTSYDSRGFAWHPNGYILAEATYGVGTHIYSFDGQNVTHVSTTGDTNNSLWCAWSPNGKYFATTGSANTSIFQFNGTNLTLVDSVALTARSVDWHPSGQYLALGIYGSANQLYQFDGTSLTYISSTSDAENSYSIAWSLDGNYLAAANDGDVNRVYILSGTTLTSVATTVGQTNKSYGVAWTPDGNYIAFANGNSQVNRLYRFNGTSLSLASSTSENDTSFSAEWSPDGNYLAVGNGSGTNRIYQLIGENLILITNAVGDAADYISWSPDGQFISVSRILTTNPIYKAIFGPDPQIQAPSNSISFQDLTHNILPDASIFALGGSQIILDGYMKI